MPIPVQCQTCQKKFKANDAASGKILACPNCHAMIHVPDVNWVNEIEFKEPHAPPAVELLPVVEEVSAIPPRAPKPRQPFDYQKWQGRIKVVTFWLSILMFFVTMREPGFATISHYTALGLLTGIGASWFATKWIPMHRRATIIVAVAVALFLWGRSDYYIKRWEKFNDGEPTKYSDYYRRFSNTLFYRDIWIELENGSHHIEGSFSESRKPHGHWHESVADDKANGYKYFDYKEQAIPGWFYKDTWYWYGEEITEGEWHLRNK